MHRAPRLLMVLLLIGTFMQLPAAGWAADTHVIKAPEAVKSPTRIAPAAGDPKTARPDLVVSKINFSPGNPVTDDEITLWVFVKNAGRGASGPSEVQVKVGGESNPPVIRVPALDPGREYRYTKKIAFGRAGNYIVTATADVRNAVAESHENNNIQQKTIQVKPPAKPDLVVTKINYSPAKPKQHEQVKVWIFVKNMGPGKSGQCYVSKTNSMNNYSIWGKKSVPALDPGQEYRADFFFLSNQAGTYYMRAVVDREHRVDETKEDNNSLDRKIVVGPPAN